MQLRIVTSDGKKFSVWIPCGLKIGSREYIDLLKTHVKPWIDANYPNGNYVWQQDSAPGHKAKKPQEWLRRHFAEHWSPDMWPPASPDANPLDYGVWGVFKGRACDRHHMTVESLVNSVDNAWANMTEDFIIKTCSKFRGRLEAIIAANGGHIED